MHLPRFVERAVASRQFQRQWLAWALLVGVFAALLVFMQWREYRSIDRDERTHLQTQVRVAERVLTGQIQSVDTALRTMLGSLDRWRGADGYLPFAHEHLKRVEAMMPGAQAFVVLDAKGQCKLSSSPDLMDLDFSHSDFYLDAKASADARQLQVAPPFRSVLGVWTVTVARAVVGQDGAFEGVVAAMLSPDYFQSLMQRLRYSEDMRVALIHSAGLMYVSSPPGAEMQQTNYAEGENFFVRHRGMGLDQSFHLGMDVGGVERVAMLQTVRLPDTPPSHSFIAVASRDVDAIYRQWERDSLNHVAFLLAAMVLSAMALARYQKGASALRKKARDSEEALLRSHRRFEQVASTIPSVLFDFDMARRGGPRVIYVSPYSQQLLGLSPEQLMDDPMRMLRHIHSLDGASIRKTLLEAVRKGSSFDCEFRYTPRHGAERWIRMSATPGVAPVDEAQAEPGARHLPHWSGYLVDITDAKTHQQTLYVMAYQDPLTGAANRRNLMEKLQVELARVHRTHAEASLIMMDVDFFKRINDTYGHDVGDEVLKHLVTTLQHALRSIDTLGRLGGEEFAILLPQTPLDAALTLAERLRVHVAQSPAVAGPHSVAFTVSMGVATLHAQTTDTNEAIKQADEAMYQAKQTGRNRVCSAAAEHRQS